MAAAIVAFLAAEALTAALAFAYGFAPLSAASWQRYHSGLYLEIAASGLSLAHCPPGSGYPADFWCGNAGPTVYPTGSCSA